MVLAVTCSFRDRAAFISESSPSSTLNPDHMRGTGPCSCRDPFICSWSGHRPVLSSAATTVQTSYLEHLHCVLELFAE
jgi:hypothetical protein